MQLPAGFLDELRARVSLASIVGRSVSWDPRKSVVARGDFWAPCPFHQEKSASFHVDEGKGYYYCFGCHAKGDAISFLRETRNLGFMEAVEALAGEAGMEMPARDPAAAARTAANQGLLEAHEAAVRFYRTQLNGARAAEARAYLDRRGLSPAARETFEIGFAPDARTALLEHLTGKGFALETLVEAGLASRPRGGGAPFDRFRGRIMFPIRDGRGRAIAFGARAVAPGQEPKYLNSPDTPLFDKGRTLYNAFAARPAAVKAGTVIVTEGYMDVIALAEAGIAHAVAPLGTAITEHQLALLWKLSPEPVVALDGDRAGLAAAYRLIDLALPELGPTRSLRFALMPPGQDPDDVVRAGGPAAIAALIEASQPVVALLWTRETEGQVLDSPERRAALDARLRAHLARIADAGLRAHWQAEIRARRAELFAPPPREPAARPGRAAGRGKAIRVPGGPTLAAKGSFLAREPGAEAAARLRESAILTGCLNHPDLARTLEDRLERLAFRCADLAEIRDALLAALHEAPEAPGPALARRLGRDPLPELAACGGPLQANRHLRADADPALAARALDEQLTRHVAMIGRAEEIRDAVLDVAAADDTLTLRVRAAAEAALNANTRPLEDDEAADDSERLEFARLIEAAEARSPRRPRRN